MAGYDYSKHPNIPYVSALVLDEIRGGGCNRKFAFGSVGTTYTMVSIGNILWLPTTAVTLRVKAGGNINDNQAGTGARSVTIEGLDINGLEVSETLLMHATDGTLVGVTGTQEFLRVNRAYVASKGAHAGETNVGAVTVEVSDASADVIQITADMGQSETSHISVPSNKAILFQDFFAFADGTKQATIRVIWRTSDGIRRSQQWFVSIQGQVTVTPLTHQEPFNSGISDFWIEAFIPSTGGDLSTLMSYHTYLTA